MNTASDVDAQACKRYSPIEPPVRLFSHVIPTRTGTATLAPRYSSPSKFTPASRCRFCGTPKSATTMDIYTHVPTAATRTALAKLSQQLGDPGSDLEEIAA